MTGVPWRIHRSPEAEQGPSDAGFTLTELLVAMTISVLIMGAVGFSLVSMLRTVEGAEDRVGRTNDSSLVSYTFSRDVASASRVVGGSTQVCAGGSVLLMMTTTNVARSAPEVVPPPTPVWYCVTDDSKLVRHECASDADCAAGSYAQSMVLADDILTSGTARPAVDCQAQDAAAAGGFTSLSGCPAEPAQRVRRVMLTLTLAPRTTAERGADAALPVAAFGIKP